MKYISTIVRENKMIVKKKTVKKRKIITVAVQQVDTRYIKVYAKNNTEAESIAKQWYAREKNVDSKIVHKDGEPLEYLNGPTTYGFTTNILGKPIDQWVDFEE